MNEYVGEKTTYVVLQETTETENGVARRVPLMYDTGIGAFSHASDFLGATQFDTQEEAVGLATLQNQISEILKQSYNYIVIKNVVVREVVSPDEPVDPEQPIPEPEPEPEEPIEEPVE